MMLSWLLAVSILTYGLASGGVDAASPRAVAGALDLSTWEFPRQGVVHLAGEWEFYWQQLLDPSAFRRPDRPQPTGLITLPGAWTGYPADTGPLPAEGFATYRLVVRLPASLTSDRPGGAPLALHFPWALTAYRLWLNGELLASNGTVGTAEDAMTPRFLPLTIPFSAESPEVEIVAQVSNYMHRNGGLWNTPVLGTYPQMVRRETARVAVDLLVVGAVLLMAVYHLAVYSFLRESSASVYIGLTGIVIALRTLVTSEHVLGRLLGGLPWGLEIRLEYITGYLFLITFLYFLRTLFPQETSKVAVGAGTLLGAFGVVLTVLAPVRLSSRFVAYYMLLFALFVVYSAVIFLVAASKGRDGARVILAGGLALNGALLHDLLHYNLLGLDLDLLPVGMLLLFFFQALTLANRFAVIFRREVALSTENAQLLDTVRAQLSEVRASRKLIVSVDENLRRSLAERMHGHIQSRLLRAWHQIGVAKDDLQVDRECSEKILEEVRTDLDQLREEEIRQVSHLLHPSIVGVGLIPAVRSLVAEFQGSLAIDVEHDEKVMAWDDPVDNRIPESVRLVAYRVLEEALNNVLAHAEATSVQISLAITDDERLALTVRDNGRGFDPQSVERHLGLNTVAARVDSVDGAWEIESRPGRGAVVSVHLPLVS